MAYGHAWAEFIDVNVGAVVESLGDDIQYTYNSTRPTWPCRTKNSPHPCTGASAPASVTPLGPEAPVPAAKNGPNGPGRPTVRTVGAEDRLEGRDGVDDPDPGW